MDSSALGWGANGTPHDRDLKSRSFGVSSFSAPAENFEGRRFKSQCPDFIFILLSWINFYSKVSHSGISLRSTKPLAPTDSKIPNGVFYFLKIINRLRTISFSHPGLKLPALMDIQPMD